VLHRLLEGLESADKNGNGDRQNSTNHSVVTPDLKPAPVIGKYFIEKIVFY
jgi:hypothetical protein